MERDEIMKYSYVVMYKVPLKPSCETTICFKSIVKREIGNVN